MINPSQIEGLSAEIEGKANRERLARIATLALKEVVHLTQELARVRGGTSCSRIATLVLKNEEKQSLIKVLDKRVDYLRATIERLSCAQPSSFNHTPEQWRMCLGCSAKQAVRGEELNYDSGS